MSGKSKVFIIGAAGVLTLTAIALSVVFFGVIARKKYTAKDFGIETYRSAVDRDGDGTDDQTDILRSVREYLDTKPKY